MIRSRKIVELGCILTYRRLTRRRDNSHDKNKIDKDQGIQNHSADNKLRSLMNHWLHEVMDPIRAMEIATSTHAVASWKARQWAVLCVCVCVCVTSMLESDKHGSLASSAAEVEDVGFIYFPVNWIHINVHTCFSFMQTRPIWRRSFGH